jgi:hypothetical protein
MSVSGWIRQQEGEPRITQKTQMARLPCQGARLEAMSLQPAFACFALFAVPLALRRADRLRAMTLEGYCQATQRVIGRLSENHRGLRRFGKLVVQRLASPRNPPKSLCRSTGDPRRWLCTYLGFGTEKGFAAIINLSKRE